MQIVNYLRATVFKSSYAALDLATKNLKYLELAKNIVSVKQENALCKLIILHSAPKKYDECLHHINKYDSILKKLSPVENMLSKNADSNLGDAFNGLPRLEILRLNDNTFSIRAVPLPTDSGTIKE